MSDEKLRELERRFRETGSAEDEVAWLRERARSGEKLDGESYSRLHELDVDAAADYLRWRVATGDLSQERLELAAHARHGAACEGECPEPLAFGQWLVELGRWGKSAMDRGLWLAARTSLLAVESYDYGDGSLDPSALRLALDEVEQYTAGTATEIGADAQEALLLAWEFCRNMQPEFPKTGGAAVPLAVRHAAFLGTHALGAIVQDAGTDIGAIALGFDRNLSPKQQEEVRRQVALEALGYSPGPQNPCASP